jgi:signal transduction histidine kinase
MAIVLAGTGLFVRAQVKSDLDHALDASLRSQASVVAALAQQSDTGLADAKHSGTVRQPPQLAQIIDVRGRVIDATPAATRHPLLDRASLARARTRSFTIPSTTIGEGQPVSLLATPITAQSQRLVVVVGQSLAGRDQAIDDLTNVLLLGGPIALALASLAGYALTGAALRPVELMRRRERRFIADASHELRSPLTMLRMELELMARDQPRGADLETAIASAIEETDRLSGLTDDLLLLSRADHRQLALRRTPVQPYTLIHAAVARVRRRPAASGIRFRVDGDPGLPIVLADSDQVGRAIDNMLDNALRYAASEVELAARVVGGRVEIHALDDGAGFPPEFLPHAWERFSRPDAARTDDGAGLGLSIIRTIAELQGGTATATNRPTGGADVWITLPIAAAANLPAAQPADQELTRPRA